MTEREPTPRSADRPGDGSGADPTEVRKHIRSALADQNVHLPPAQLTPAFPKSWPPTGDATVVYFVFSSRALPTGMIEEEVHSPSLRVEVDLIQAGEQVLTVSALSSEALSPPKPMVLEPVARETIIAAERVLFHALTRSVGTGSLPSGEPARTLRQTYATWSRQNTALTDHLKTKLPEFFAWIESHP